MPIETPGYKEIHFNKTCFHVSKVGTQYSSDKDCKCNNTNHSS